MPTSIDGYIPVGPFARNSLAPGRRRVGVGRLADLFVERPGTSNICRAYLISDSCGRLGRSAVRALEIRAMGPGRFDRPDIVGRAGHDLVGYPDRRLQLVARRSGITGQCNRPPASRAATDSLSGMGCQIARWSPGFWVRRSKLFV